MNHFTIQLLVSGKVQHRFTTSNYDKAYEIFRLMINGQQLPLYRIEGASKFRIELYKFNELLEFKNMTARGMIRYHKLPLKQPV